MRNAKKSSLYRNEVTEAAVRAVLEALERFPDYRAGAWRPQPLAEAPAHGRLRPAMRQPDRAIDWQRDETATVLRKLNAADGVPGVRDALFGEPCWLFDAQAVPGLRGEPGALLGRCGDALLRATADGAVRIGHVRRSGDAWSIKLPAAVAFADAAAALPELDLPDAEIRYAQLGDVGYLSFDFYNGAMASEQCERLADAVRAACRQDTRVLVLLGGQDFWSNGIHLNRIEAADSPADESLRNIEAMDDLALAILSIADRLVVAALQGNAGAGGCFLALAADALWARQGVVLNPHYKNMGNLYGSEYWTYLLPRRVGAGRAQEITQRRLPLSAAGAAREGLIDACFGDGLEDFRTEVQRRAEALAQAPDYAEWLAQKRRCRAEDEAVKPLAAYRAEELAEMRRNFYGFDPSYHYARQHFVFKQPHAWTPRHLALHRELAVQCPAGAAA